MSTKEILKKSFFELLDTLDPATLIQDQISFKNNILNINGTDFTLPNKIKLLGSGKAVLPMAQTLHLILKDTISSTTLVGAYPNDTTLNNLNYIQSTHPIPSQNSVDGANTLIKELQQLNSDDFFIYLLSGGNSSLVELPIAPITLDQFQATTDLMLKNGFPIESINCVRKHISQVKGGKLNTFTKAKGIVLVLCDVLGDRLDTIGSAPFYYDPSSLEDAKTVLLDGGLWDKLPKNIQMVLDDPKNETPKQQNPKIKHFVLGSNTIVLQNAQNILEKKGISSIISTTSIDDNVENITQFLSKEIKNWNDNIMCKIFGGEATVSVKSNGSGGRNQHLALLMLDHIKKDYTLLSAATDGIDGNSYAAGAIIDHETIKQIEEKNIDTKKFKEQFNSNLLFEQLDDLIITGPTHNNLLDIVIIIKQKRN